MVYGMNGGVSFSEVQKMRRKDFIWFLERLRKQKERENQEIEKIKTGSSAAPSGRMKYLGR